MTRTATSNDYRLPRSGISRRTATGHTRQGATVRNNAKLWYLTSILIAAVRRSAKTLKGDPFNR